MFKFFHLSDLHFHSTSRKNQTITTKLRWLAKTYPDHYAILTGDLTDDGQLAQYEACQEGLEVFKDRLFVCPGNHDAGPLGNFFDALCLDRFNRLLMFGMGQGKEYIDDMPVVHFLRDPDTTVMLIGLDSTLKTTHPFDFACGKIGKVQRRNLKTYLQQSTAQHAVKFVYFHHHPFLHTDPFLWLKDAEKFLRLITGQIHIMLFGHHHQLGSWQYYGIPYILAADNLEAATTVREIVVDGPKILVNTLPIET